MLAFNPTEWSRRCVVVIPCFNEGARIGAVVVRVREHLPRVIVVDDGSTDDTAKAAEWAGAEVVGMPRNGGKGAALQAGWCRARARGFSHVLMLDGDGQHAAADIPRFLGCAGATGAELVVGNRMGDCATMPWVRRKVNQWMSRWISGMTGVALPDSQCGFRLALLESLLTLPIHANRFEIESAMLVAFCRAGRRIEFVPIQTLYETSGSNINPVTDTVRWLRWRFAQKEAADPTMELPPAVPIEPQAGG